MSANAKSKTVYLIHIALPMVYVRHAALAMFLKSIGTHRTYLSVPRPDTVSSKAILSKLKDTYGQSDVAFSVVSEKPTQVLICAWRSSETTQ